MRNLLILAVAASFAVACAGRTEDEVGAAPDRGDTTAVIDDTTAVVADTAQAYPTDTTMGQVQTDTTLVQPDTTMADTTMGVDSVGAQGEVQTGDTTGAWTDTTTATPADTTAQPSQ